MPRMNIFVPIRKVDEENRIVYGVAAQEVPDRSREIMDYATTKPEFEKWSAEMHKATDGKSKGNLRAMHGKIAAGRVDAMHFDDDAKSIEIAAKVVDDGEWAKVMEGVYSGFSMGGSYAKRWSDTADKTLTRYTAVPQEISLVDRPCIPTATFAIVKADGAAEERPFKSVAGTAPEPPSNSEVAAKATELAKAAGDEKAWPAHIESARAELEKAAGASADLAKAQEAWDAQNVDLAPKIEPEAAAEAALTVEKVAETSASPVVGDEWEQVWLCKRDGSIHKKKDDLRAHLAALDADATAERLGGGVMKQLAALGEKVGIEKRTFTSEQRKHMAMTGAAMGDGSFPIENREDLKNAVQAAGRAKDKTGAQKHILRRASELSMMDEVPNEWKAAAKAAADAFDGLKKYLGEEVHSAGHAMGALDHLHTILSYQMGMPEQNDEQNSALRDAIGRVKDFISSKIQENHDPSDPAMAMAAAADGLAKRGARNSKTDMEHLQRAHDACCAAGATCSGIGADKAVVGDDLQKITAERDALSKMMGDMQGVIKQISDRLELVEKTPMPLPFQQGGTRAVTKAEEMGGGAAELTLEKMMETPDGSEAVSLALIKASQTNPQRMQIAR